MQQNAHHVQATVKLVPALLAQDVLLDMMWYQEPVL